MNLCLQDKTFFNNRTSLTLWDKAIELADLVEKHFARQVSLTRCLFTDPDWEEFRTIFCNTNGMKQG